MEINRDGNICFLSGLEIPDGKRTIEHYVPLSRAPRFITTNPQNKFPAHRIINAIKSDRLPCEWEETKWNLTYRALHYWKLKQEDSYFIVRALQNWESYVINPCEYCLLQCNKQR
jgi:hypothetical protein